MNKSFFALTSLASMAGLVVVLVGTGCAADSTQSTTDSNEPAKGDTTATPPKKPAPAPAPAPTSGGGDTKPSGGDDGAATTCMDTKPYDATVVKFHPPSVKAGSCTTDDIKTVSDSLRGAQVVIDDVKNNLAKKSKTCGDCVFGHAEDEKWAPVVLDGSNAFLNGGGCVSVVSEKVECGKAYQQWNTCLNDVCAACTDATEASKCKTDAQQGPCGAASKVLGDSCGSNVNDYLQKCFGSNPVGTVVEQLCGAPAKS